MMSPPSLPEDPDMHHRRLIATLLATACLLAAAPAHAGEIFIDFKTLGTQQTLLLDTSGVQITADDGALPAEVLMLNLNGIGVVGGASDTTTDGSEALHFEFGTLVTGAAYHVGLVNDLNTNGVLGETTLEAFVGTTSLGVVAVDDIGWKNVSGLFGGVGVTGFTVRAVGDGNRIDAMSYVSLWDDLGEGLAGTYGVPTLAGSGWLTAGLPVSIDATDLLENASAALVAGFGQLGAPFKGGLMVPTIDLLITGLPTGALGELSLVAPWPPGIPSGFSIYMQVWLPDPAGPQGFAATNAVKGTTP